MSPSPRPASAEESDRPRPVIQLVEDDDYVVRVVAGETTCSGTLVAADQVLTAHHCVSARGGGGAIISQDVEPSTVRVELGSGYLPWGEVGVRAIVSPPCGFGAGAGDIAVLVLDRELVGVATLPPMLDHAPTIGEFVEPVGFGLCPATEEGIRKRVRTGGPLDAIRPDRFRLDASICPGDSGGPALTRDGRLVGVISAAVMDGSDETVGRSEFTRVDHWRPLFANARMIAEGASPAEVPPVAGCPDL
ncbi:MAG: trypsin-like serine protease [Polyangiaceae bacterium]|nr:trypsin-like serine protease [Polyangiaceae bacterium]